MKNSSQWAPLLARRRIGHPTAFILYQRPGDKAGQDLWIAPQRSGAAGESQKPFPYLASPFNEGYGVFSPDGHWIAYESDESGRPEVYVQGFPLTNQKVRISTGGGTDAAWSKNGGELFYLAADRKLIAVPYRSTVTTFEPGAGKVLFPVPGNVVHRSYRGDRRRPPVPHREARGRKHQRADNCGPQLAQ